MMNIHKSRTVTGSEQLPRMVQKQSKIKHKMNQLLLKEHHLLLKKSKIVTQMRLVSTEQAIKRFFC